MACLVAHSEGGRAARERAREWLADPEQPGAEADAARTALAEDVPRIESEIGVLGWRFMPAGEGGYPARLATLSDAPLGLFMRGAWLAAKAVALVGSRRASAYGREVAEYLGRELARAGVTVVSGMARGVDAAAHRGALAAGGPTAAVWGCGPDRVYPPEHESLAEEIAAHGCLVTEYPPGSPPRAHHFPERNRIIAGLADVVIVVEADERSGALITAGLALEEGREVMAIPGSVFSRLSAGPNGLLRAGAAPVLTADDVLAVLGVARQPALTGTAEAPLLAAIPPGESASIDHLAAATGQPVAQVVQGLLELELAGRVSRETDGRYRRHRAAHEP